jgi:hypothetical protein
MHNGIELDDFQQLTQKYRYQKETKKRDFAAVNSEFVLIESMPNKDPRGYYLDDLTPHDVATPDYLAQQIQDHTILMELLGIPRNDKKKKKTN